MNKFAPTCVDFALGALAGTALGIWVSVKWRITAILALILVIALGFLRGGLSGVILIPRIVDKSYGFWLILALPLVILNGA